MRMNRKYSGCFSVVESVPFFSCRYSQFVLLRSERLPLPDQSGCHIWRAHEHTPQGRAVAAVHQHLQEPDEQDRQASCRLPRVRHHPLRLHPVLVEWEEWTSTDRAIVQTTHHRSRKAQSFIWPIGNQIDEIVVSSGARFQPIMMKTCVRWKNDLKWRALPATNPGKVRHLGISLAEFVCFLTGAFLLCYWLKACAAWRNHLDELPFRAYI